MEVLHNCLLIIVIPFCFVRDVACKVARLSTEHREAIQYHNSRLDTWLHQLRRPGDFVRQFVEFKGKRSRPKRARLLKQVAFLCSKCLSIHVDFVDGRHWSCGCVSKARMPKMPWKWLIWVLVGCRKQEPIPIYLYWCHSNQRNFHAP